MSATPSDERELLSVLKRDVETLTAGPGWRTKRGHSGPHCGSPRESPSRGLGGYRAPPLALLDFPDHDGRPSTAPGWTDLSPQPQQIAVPDKVTGGCDGFASLMLSWPGLVVPPLGTGGFA